MGFYDVKRQPISDFIQHDRFLSSILWTEQGYLTWDITLGNSQDTVACLPTTPLASNYKWSFIILLVKVYDVENFAWSPLHLHECSGTVR